MIKIGMMLADRYEILEKIGTGGMSDVYKAKCHKLNRFVAVKVLKQEFGENANFVAKFRIEAQAAAGLMHPNIVNVYDVGEEGGMHYIVMELVEGITLKNYIEKKARLSVKEAISIAIQVSMGIEAAHNNKIIHRDIKPQNIIISKDGKVKVTDFGIAKAATSNTVSSNVMGSVHYTSPEQARGGYSDEKSDIYSLGITLFEMLTGRVPFNGESTVGIAIKHIQEPMPSPRQYVAEIPYSVEQIVLKCCQKSPDRRYQNMAELIGDLKQSLITPDDDFVRIDDPDTTGSTRVITDEDLENIKGEADFSGEFMRLNGTGPIGAEMVENSESEEADEEYDPKMEKITTILAIVAAVLIGLVVILLVGKAVGIIKFSNKPAEEETQGKMVSMIDVLGMDYETAKKALEELNLYTDVVYEESETYAAGIVLGSSVSKGEEIEEFSQITLTVSSGTNAIEVPDITKKSYEEAKSELEKAGFEVNRAENYSSDIETGYVISQSPAGNTKAPEGSVVTITVSLGESDTKVRVPNVLGLSEMDAIATLTESELAVGNITYTNSNEFSADLVCYQSSSVNAYLEKGSTVDIKISLGPEAATYSYSGSIQGPTAAEDPLYTEGTQVLVTIVTADGKQLLSTRTSSFPIAVNYTGMTSATGTVTFTYTVNIEETTADDGTGNMVTVPVHTEEKVVNRDLQFVQE